MMSSQSSGGGNSRRHVLEVEELARIICGFLDKKDYVKLLYVSRHTYTCTLPIVWEDADLKHILFLIPGMEEKIDRSGRAEYGYVFDFPTTIDRTRFDIHAPFVKTVRTSHPYTINMPDEWPSSSPDATPKPPLPNLQRLVINGFDSHKESYVSWIPKFLHPGVLGLEFSALVAESRSEDRDPSYPWLDRDVCFDLISQVSHICPQTQILHVFPAELAQSSEYECERAYKDLASLQQLRNLKFSGTIVHEGLLQALGRLPHLETLSFCTNGDETWEYDETPLNLSDNSFPSLQHIHLYGIDESTMARICKASPLFRHLISATLIFEDQCFDDNMYDGERSDVAVTSLGKNSPHLVDLTILPRGNNGWFRPTRLVINAFKHMNLRCLDLGELGFESGGNDESGDDDEDQGDHNTTAHNSLPNPGWTDFFSAVPYLEELRIRRQEIKPLDLRLFATALPHLRMLMIATVPLGNTVAKAEERGTAINHGFTLSSWSYFKARKERAEDEAPNAKSVSNAARYIYDIWPNVTCKTHGLKWDYGNAVPHEKALAKLNEALELLKSNK